MKKHLIYFVSLLIFSIILCGAASAANINVNTTTGIQNAINTASPGDTLNLSSGTYNEHDISVNKNLTITGPDPGINPPSAVVDAQNLGRVFNIASGVNVTLKYLTIQNGKTTSGLGGGIYNLGRCTVIVCSINNNSASSGGGISNNLGVLSVTGCEVYNNTAKTGGGISNCGYCFVTYANVNGNMATSLYGGGIYNYGTCILTDSNVFNNRAPMGGGIAIYDGSVDVTGSNIYGNTATSDGGGIYTYYGDYDCGIVDVTSSNVYSNTATRGGGIYNLGTATLNFCRIIGNTATTGNDIHSYGAVNAQYNWWGSNSDPVGKVGGSVTITPWLVLNLEINPATIPTGNKSNVSADLQHDSSGNYHNPSEGHVDGDTYLLPITFGTTDSPTLGTFNYVTRNLVNGNATTVFTGTTIGTAHIIASLDGYTVPGVINIEGPRLSDVYVATDGNDINSGTSSSPVKTLFNALKRVIIGGNIHLGQGTYTGVSNIGLTIDRDVTIFTDTWKGTGSVIFDGENISRILTINSGINVVLRNLTFINGNTTYGGAIFNKGNLNVINCTFTNNTAEYGGGIWNDQYSTAIFTNSIIYCNTATTTAGGGIYNYLSSLTLIGSNLYKNTAPNNGGGGIFNNAGNMTFTGSNVFDNSAHDGGGIYNTGMFVLINSKIYNNTAIDGGGLLNYNGNLNLTSSNVFKNNAQNHGGAIYNDLGTLILTGSNLYNNTAVTMDGGAIYNHNTGTVNSTNSNLYNNTARNGGGILNDENCIVAMVNSTVYNNTATNAAGAIYNNVGAVTITNSSINDNSAPNNNGGAIYNAGTLNLTNSKLYNNNAINGGAIYTYYRPLTFTGSNIYNNTATGCGGAIYNGGTATLNFCRITGNTAPSGSDIYNTGTAEATLNWWGSNQGPSSNVAGSVTVSPWLVLNMTANPTTIQTGGTSNITADLLHDSSGGYHDPASGHILDGIPVKFATTLGTINSPLSTVNGTAVTILNGGAFVGVTNVNATVDTQTAHTPVTIIDTIPPTLTSIDPTNGALNVARDKVIKVTFSEPVKVGNMWIELYNAVGTKTLIPITTSISGNVLTINHVALLSTGTKYILAFHSGSVTDLAGNSLAGVARYFTTSTDGTAPTITSTDPLNNAVNVARDKVIKVTFSEPVKVGNMWIELYNAVGTKTLIPITTSISGNVLTINHAVLLANGTKYILAFHSGSVTDLAGNSLAGVARYFTTSTDGTAPTITSTDPLNNAVNVARDKVIKVTFSEPVKVGNMWIELYNAVGTKTLIPITTSISGNVLTINHAALLANGTKYTLAFHTGSITDNAGNPVASTVRYFTTSTDTTTPTITSTDPANNAVNVARNKVITVTFNEPIKAGNMWIELYNTTGTKTPIAITTSISGNVLTINHAALLAIGTKYTLAFHTGSITDAAGNPVASAVRYFTTANT